MFCGLMYYSIVIKHRKSNPSISLFLFPVLRPAEILIFSSSFSLHKILSPLSAVLNSAPWRIITPNSDERQEIAPRYTELRRVPRDGAPLAYPTLGTPYSRGFPPPSAGAAELPKIEGPQSETQYSQSTVLPIQDSY